MTSGLSLLDVRGYPYDIINTCIIIILQPVLDKRKRETKPRKEIGATGLKPPTGWNDEILGAYNMG